MPRALPAVLLACAWLGCFSPEYQTGGFPCGPSGECPSGFVCDGPSSKCYAFGTIPPADACVQETDAVFCARQVKDCALFSGVDNCGLPRTADCGTCDPSVPICASNICRAPVCGTAFASAGTVVASASGSGTQDALLGASSDGTSILLLRATGTCVGGGATLLVGDDATGTLSYTTHDITTVANLASFTKGEETMTLTADGLTIIGVTTASTFASSTRSAAGQVDFGAASSADFATVNASLPGGGYNWPYLSSDGLAFYFHAAGGAADGIYEALRASTTVPFDAPHLMAGNVQSYGGLMSLSTDRMTAFFSNGFGTAIMTRTSLTDPFTAPATTMPPGAAWRVVPIAGCAKVLGTCEPGGCQNEDVCVWAKQ
jgi:hypothetical protein